MAAIIFVAAWYLNRSDRVSPPATAMTGLSTCGPVRLHQITLIYTDGRPPEDRLVATFFPWGCPADQKADCKFTDPDPAYPDPACTPGAIYDLTGNTNPADYDETRNQQLVCQTIANARTGSKDRRDVSHQVDTWIWRRYNLPRPRRGSETDHFIPVGLDGSNEPANLEPQTKSGPYDADEKEVVESMVATQVRDQCDGHYDSPYMTLSAAHCIMRHWTQYSVALRDKRIAKNGRGWESGPC